MKIGTCDNLVQQNWILTAIVEYDMHCMYITSNDMLPRKLKDLIGDQAEEVSSVIISSSSLVSCIYPSDVVGYKEEPPQQLGLADERVIEGLQFIEGQRGQSR